MAAPTIVQSTSGGNSANTTSHSITMPGGMTNGNLIVVIWGCDGNTPLTFTSGWTKIDQEAQGAVVKGVILYKYVTGSDSLTITTNASEQSSSIVYELNNAAPPLTASSSGNSTNGDPPNLATDKSRDYLWIAAYISDDQNVASAAPSGYANLITKNGGSTGAASISTADKTATASSEDPGTFTSATEQWVTFTLGFGAKDSYYLALLETNTGSNDNSAGSFAWSNATAVSGAEDGTFAFATLSGTSNSNYLKAVGFGAAIDSSASILGVKLSMVKARTGGTTGAGRDAILKLLKAGTLTGNDKADTATNWLTTSDTVNYGGYGDLWGVSLYPDDINNANFGVEFAVKGSTAGTDRVANVDNLSFIIQYSLPAASSGGMSTFSDNFDDNSTDTGKWTATNIGTGTIAETGGKLVVTFPGSPATGGGQYVSVNNYDLVANAAFIKLDTAPASGGDEAKLQLYRDATSYLDFGYDGTTDKIVAAKGVTGIGYTNMANTAYNSTNHKWLRIREASGTIYWDTSTDGITWSNFHSLATPFSVSNLTVKIITQDFVFVSGGATFDNFNTVPAKANFLTMF